MTFENLRTAALQLDMKSRARLARELLTSLEDLSEDEMLALWDEEAQRRDAEIDRDPSVLVDGEKVRAEALARFPRR